MAGPSRDGSEDYGYRDSSSLLELLGVDPSSESQHTSYSDWGDDDISEAIIALPVTQPSGEEKPPDSVSSSERSLGKRKASELSTSSGSLSQGHFRPSKLAKWTPPVIDDDNPFLAQDKPEDPHSPISFSPSRVMQNIFNAKKLPYGVQYEIARYVSLGKIKYPDIYMDDVVKLAKLDTNQKAAPATRKIILKDQFEEDDDNGLFKRYFAKEYASKSPWKELDAEEVALKDNPYGGLGLNEKGENTNWHGGQVLFHGKLLDTSAKTGRKPKYKITLEPAELGPSNMFARRFGSKHFFRLKLSKGVLNKSAEDLMIYLQRPLILCGGVFRAFYAKESNVFYVKTNEPTDGTRILSHEPPAKGVMTFLQFLDWHNPMHLNICQTMAKYVSRFALGLSNSVPGLMLDQSNIHFIDDIISETGSNMTDGAGKINRWSLKQIRHRLDWEDKPTAIQTRIFGTKGLLVDDGRNTDEFGYVELTPSQRKIIYPENTAIDPAHRIIDVLRASHTKSPCRLSVETIINLAENGVSKEIFLQLLRQSLAELVEPLLDWDSPGAMHMLWCNVRRLGGVMAARRAREEAGLARVKGYSERDAEEIELEDEDGFTLLDSAEQVQRSSAWWGDEISGCPSSLEETIMCMVDSNFTPRECPVLRHKLQMFIKGRVKEYIKSYRIDVSMSASAFLVPDTSMILEPGEVFFKCSRRQFRNADGTETDIYVGDVLLTRHPCKLPTDIQKWKSVDRPELHHLVDVIVFSTKGLRRAADFLSGGDYDGDKGIFIYDPELVNAFKNAEEHFSEPPKDIKSHFEPKNEEVAAFQKRTSSLPIEGRIRELQKFLLGAVRDTTIVGKYSNFHEMATYTMGYIHPETIRLAYMFCMTLDGIKTGMTVLPETFKKDTAKYNKRAPVWKETEEDRERNRSNDANAKRPSRLGRFIMDELHKQAGAEGDRWLSHIDKHFGSATRSKVDEQLAEPYNNAKALSVRWEREEKNSRMARDLKKLENHVEKVWNEHRSEMSSPRKASRNSPKKDKSSFTDQPIEVRQDKFRNLSRKFAEYPPPSEFMMLEEEVARVKASYAYVYDCQQRKHNGTNNWTRFPFDVAMRELCAIKARASGRHKTVAGDFYDHFNMKHPKKHHI